MLFGLVEKLNKKHLLSTIVLFNRMTFSVISTETGNTPLSTVAAEPLPWETAATETQSCFGRFSTRRTLNTKHRGLT